MKMQAPPNKDKHNTQEQSAESKAMVHICPTMHMLSAQNVFWDSCANYIFNLVNGKKPTFFLTQAARPQLKLVIGKMMTG